ncbi:uncharacterized protein [Palaemon carinicauda]|uniref:uncharacterized protein n=1 Tax=Palaemon carinicauda TaxID=392227 RepID=UPI0035B6967F
MMEEHIVLTKTKFETVRRLFRGKRMKILDLERDNENLRKAFAARYGHHGNLKALQDMTENVEPISFSHRLKELQKFVQKTTLSTSHEYSEPSILNHADRRVLESPQEETNPYVMHSSHRSNDEARAYQNHTISANTNPVFGNRQQVNTLQDHNPVSFSRATENQISASYNPIEFPQTTTGPPSVPSVNPQRTENARIKTQQHLSVQPEYVNVQFPSQNTSVGQSLLEQKQAHNSQQSPSYPLQQSLPYPHYPAYSQSPWLKPPPPYQNSHCSNISSLSRSLQSNQALDHQLYGSLNMASHSYPQVPQQTFYGQISSHHQPTVYSQVPRPSYSRNIPYNQLQNHPQTIQQAQFGVNHHYSHMHSQTLPKQCPTQVSWPQHQTFMERLPQSHTVSHFPCPRIHNESSNNGQQHQPHNLSASHQEHDLRHNLSPYQSSTKDATQPQNQFNKRPGENTDHALPHNRGNEEFGCQIVYENLNRASNQACDKSSPTRHQNNDKTFPITESEYGYQTGNCGQSTFSSKPFSSSCFSTTNAKTTCSLPLVMTPPLTPPTSRSSTSIQLNSNSHYNDTSNHDSNSMSAQNLHTSQFQPLSIRNQLSLSHDSSKKPVEVDALEKSNKNSANLFISEQKCEQTGEISVERDSTSNLNGFSDSKSRHRSLVFSDISDDEVILEKANCTPEDSILTSSEELSLSQNSSLLSSVSQSLNNKTSVAMINTPVKTTDKNTIASSYLEPTEESVAMINTPVKTTDKNTIASSYLEPTKESVAMINTPVKATDENTIASSYLEPTEESAAMINTPVKTTDENTISISYLEPRRVTVPSVPSEPLFNSISGPSNDFQSDVNNDKSRGSAFSRAEINLLSKNCQKLWKGPARGQVCIPESLVINCFVCRRKVKGKDVLLHMIFGHLKCKMCGLTVRSCQELRERYGKECPCRNAVVKNHDFSLWDPNPVDFLCFQIWQHSHNRERGVPSSGRNLLKMREYLETLTPLCNVKPWSSAYRKCQKYVNNSSKVCSSDDTSIKSSRGSPATEAREDKICRSNNDLLSRVLIEAEVGIEKDEAVNVSNISITSEYDLMNTVSGAIEASRNLVSSEPCSASTSLTEGSCKGSVNSVLSSICTSGVEESSTCSANSKSTYIRTSGEGEVSKGLVNSEPCSTSTSSVMVKSSKCMIESESCNFSVSMNNKNSSVNVKDRFMEGEVQSTTLSKGERNSEEEETDVVVKISGGKLVKPSVIVIGETQPSKDLDVVKEEIPEMNEIEENVDFIHSEYLAESSCSVDSLDRITEYVTVCDGMGGMSEEELPPIDEISSRHSQSNEFIDSHEISDSQSFYDRSSNSQCGGSSSQDSGNLEMTKKAKFKPSKNHSDGQAGQNHSDGQAGQNHSDGQAGQNHSDSQAGQNHSDSQAGQNHSDSQAGQNHSDSQAGQNHSDSQAGQNHSDGQAVRKVTSEDSSSLRDFPTLVNISSQEPSNLSFDENHLVINLQAVETGGLANVECPEECPLCYTMLCPSGFHVNLKSFHLTTCCRGCGLFITITLGESQETPARKNVRRHLGPKSKTDPLVTKKRKLTD